MPGRSFRSEKTWERSEFRNRDGSSRFNAEINRPSHRYRRDGPLSPLRSPLRQEDTNKSNRGRHRWAAARKEVPREDVSTGDEQYFSMEEFPSLGSVGRTPEPCRSAAIDGKDWATLVEEAEEQENRKQEYQRRPKRKLLLPDKSLKVVHSEKECETDPQVIERRLKVLRQGKGTTEYGRYLKEVPRHLRTKAHPRTPNKYQKCSRRSWDMQVKLWRRNLHIWDPPEEGLFRLPRPAPLYSDTSSECSSEYSTGSFDLQPVEDLSMDDRDNNNLDLAVTSDPALTSVPVITSKIADTTETAMSCNNTLHNGDFFNEFDLDRALMEDNFVIAN